VIPKPKNSQDINDYIFGIKEIEKGEGHKFLPRIPKVVFDSWLLNICLAWKVFVNIPFHRGARIPSFTF
jgi:hypothetical protein